MDSDELNFGKNDLMGVRRIAGHRYNEYDMDFFSKSILRSLYIYIYAIMRTRMME